MSTNLKGLKLLGLAIGAMIGLAVYFQWTGLTPVESEPSSGLSGQVRIDGSSTVFPLTEAVAEEFQRAHRRVRVTVGVSGTGGGFQKFLKGETAINNASRPIKPNEIQQGQANNIQFIELPVAFDGIAVVVSQQNDFVTRLTLDQLKQIWEPNSKTSMWSDLNPAWPQKEIKLYGPGPDSGTFDYFTEEVMGQARVSRSDYTASEDDNVLVTGIATDPYALGYFGAAYYGENKDKLKAVALDAGQGAIDLTEASIETGSYPLARPLFIYINEQKTQTVEVDAFVRFYLKHAGTLASQVGYVALPADAYQKALKRYESKTTGTKHASL